MSRASDLMDRFGPLVGWTLAALAVGMATAAAVVAGVGPAQIGWKAAVIPAMWAVPGALIAAGRPRIAVGWLLLGVALLFATSVPTS